MRRAIQRYIEDEISEKILKGEIIDGQEVFVEVENTVFFCAVDLIPADAYTAELAF